MSKSKGFVLASSTHDTTTGKRAGAQARFGAGAPGASLCPHFSVIQRRNFLLFGQLFSSSSSITDRGEIGGGVWLRPTGRATVLLTTLHTARNGRATPSAALWFLFSAFYLSS